MSDDTTANGAVLTDAEREALWTAATAHAWRGVTTPPADLYAEAERILAARVAPLLAERDALRGKVAAVRDDVTRLADSIDGDSGWEHNGGCEGEPDCFACIVLDLRQIAERLDGTAARVAPLLAERDALRGKVAALEDEARARMAAYPSHPHYSAWDHYASDLTDILDALAAAQPERDGGAS